MNRSHCPPRCTNSFYPNPDNHNRRRRIRTLGCSVETPRRGSAQEYSGHKPGKCCGSTAGWWAPGKRSHKRGILTLPPSHPWLLLFGVGDPSVACKHKQEKLRSSSRVLLLLELQVQPWPEERHQHRGGRLTLSTNKRRAAAHTQLLLGNEQIRTTIGQVSCQCEASLMSFTARFPADTSVFGANSNLFI